METSHVTSQRAREGARLFPDSCVARRLRILGVMALGGNCQGRLRRLEMVRNAAEVVRRREAAAAGSGTAVTGAWSWET